MSVLDRLTRGQGRLLCGSCSKDILPEDYASGNYIKIASGSVKYEYFHTSAHACANAIDVVSNNETRRRVVNRLRRINSVVYSYNGGGVKEDYA